jgi:3',5'-cyclic AMP phosphodiesterase CpdA
MKKIIAILLTITLLFTSIGCVSYAIDFKKDQAVTSMSFATISDLHFYPQSMMSDSKAWEDYCKSTTKQFPQSEQMLRTAIETAMARNPELKYILVPGDLTKDSEYEAHVALAAILEEYEEKYDVDFLVTTGNHDINQAKSVTFANGKQEAARALQADEFDDVYANLGFDLAFTRYGKDGDNKLNQLSYAADLKDNSGKESYRLIVIDSCKYQFDSKDADKETSGAVTPELMAWVKNLAEDAYKNGKTPMVMIHHGLAAHMETEPSITFAFPLDDYMQVAETFASWGIHYAFTGHLHTDDIASVINDDGEVLYDIETASVTGYPCTYREMTINTYKSGESDMSFDSIAFDDAVPFTYDGVTYEKGTYGKEVFHLSYGGLYTQDGKADATAFLFAIVKSTISKYIDSIKEVGSIGEFLKTMNIDLEKIIGDFLSPYIGDGIKIGGYNIFSAENIMWFVNDLLDQVYDLYIKDDEKLYTLLSSIIEELVTIQVSDVPCTKYIEEYGFGDKNRPGNLGDMLLTILVSWYSGNETIEEDPFLQDTIKKFEEAHVVETLFNKIVDLLLHTLIEDNILSKLEIRIDKLMNDDFIGKNMGNGVNYLLSYVLKGDFTYMNLVNTVFAMGVLPYESIYDILDKELLQKYLTFSQFEGVGAFIAYVVNDFTNDINPQAKGDYNVTYSTEKVDVPVTRENYRLPTMVSVTLGKSSDQAVISWFSKSTVDGDIEIYKADSEPSFKGKATKTADFTIKTESETVIRSFYGIDIGIIGFLPYEFEMNRHTVTLSGLEKGATYYYRVGSEEKGWWSDIGSVRTQDGSKDITFLHLADPQSQSEAQYQRAWADVLGTSFELYPEADFIIGTGDMVDHGDNQKQWAWMFNTASDYLMNTYMMPASGNHEGHGTNAIDNYFVLPNAPEQDKTGGVYYSFDYNNAHFAVLNTENLNENEALSDDQINWLRDDMSKSDAQWKFVTLHKAVYSQGSHYEDDDVIAIRAQLQTLMPELGIDMVFQGHDHVYMRTGSLVNNALTAYDTAYLNHDGKVYKTQVQPTGTTYVISGTCGVKTYIQNDVTLTDELFPRGETILSVDAPMFSAVEIKDGVLYFDAYYVTADGAQIADSFAIQKDKTQGDVAEGYTPPADDNIQQDDFTATLKKIAEVLRKIITVVMNIAKWYIF